MVFIENPDAYFTSDTLVLARLRFDGLKKIPYKHVKWKPIC